MATRSIDHEPDRPARRAVRSKAPVIGSFRLPNGEVVRFLRRDIFEKAIDSVRMRKDPSTT